MVGANDQVCRGDYLSKSKKLSAVDAIISETAQCTLVNLFLLLHIVDIYSPFTRSKGDTRTGPWQPELAR